MSQFTYNGNVIEVEVVNENPQREKDLKIGGALVQALSFENTIEQQVDENGVTWFKAKDICTSLGYDANDINKHLQRHVEKADQMSRLDRSSGQGRNVKFINESGLYSLILGSTLESAKKFKHWVTSEVLPSIRKTGSYSTQQVPLVLRTINDALARQHKSTQATNKAVREQRGKDLVGEGMEHSRINISKMSNALAFGKHYSCEMRQILTEDEAIHLIMVMRLFESFHKSNPNLELTAIKKLVGAVTDPMMRIITKEEIERRLKVKKELEEGTKKTLKDS